MFNTLYLSLWIINGSAINIIPTGIIVAFHGVIIPFGWNLCDGTNGTPDLRGRFILSSGQGAGLTNRNPNDTGGDEIITLNIDQIPSHTHTMNSAGDHNHNVNVIDPNSNACFANGGNCAAPDKNNIVSATTTTNGAHTHTINNTGGNQPHNNMPPYYVLRYIMKI